MNMSTRKIVAEYDRISPLYSFGNKIAFPHRDTLIIKHVLPKIDITPGDTVVDLCCGAGHNLPALVRAVGTKGQVIGVDLSEKLLQQARYLVEKNSWPNVFLHNTDACRLSEVANSVDIVFISLALSLMPDKALVLDEIKKILKPGGYLVVIEFRPFRGIAKLLNPILYTMMLPTPNINRAIFKEADLSLDFISNAFPNYSYSEYYSGGNYVVIASME
jgi:ubiquinone/menaquinone biosynthesis C-methylase UbiE